MRTSSIRGLEFKGADTAFFTDDLYSRAEDCRCMAHERLGATIGANAAALACGNIASKLRKQRELSPVL